MLPVQVEFTLKWVNQLLSPTQRHTLIARAVAQMPDTPESLTLYEVAQRLKPQTFAALFKPPIIGELFLVELLTWEQGSGILVLLSSNKESCDESDCERV